MRRWVVLASLAGCGGSAAVCPSTMGICRGDQVEQTFDELTTAPVDALIVIDDSPSMAARGDVLAALADALARTLSDVPGPIDVEALVVTTSARDHGNGECAHPAVGPPMCGTERVLRLTQTCGARSNLIAGLPETFSCALSVGSGGCSVEQPLAAMRAALEGPLLRPGAHPFVLLVTDEDDCSAPPGPLPFEVDPASAAVDDPGLSARCRDADQQGRLDPVGSYADLLTSRGAKLSVLATLPAPRLEALAAALPSSEVRPLSADNAIASLASLGERFGFINDPFCAPEGLVDRDPDAPGLQAECVLTEEDSAGGRHPLPSCEAGGAACWRLAASAVCPSGLVWSIDHGGCFPPRGTLLHVACAVAP